MNIYINFDDLVALSPHSTLQLPKDHISRSELCPFCTVHLVECFREKSDMPLDVMQVSFGNRYNTWYESSGIHCPVCKIVFRHTPHTATLINKYVKVVSQGFIHKLILEEDFLVSQYKTRIQNDIKKGTVVYTTEKGVKMARRGQMVTSSPFGNLMWKLKEGCARREEIPEANIVDTSPFEMKEDAEKWEETTALHCALSPSDLFTGSIIAIPAAIVGLSVAVPTR